MRGIGARPIDIPDRLRSREDRLAIVEADTAIMALPYMSSSIGAIADKPFIFFRLPLPLDLQNKWKENPSCP